MVDEKLDVVHEDMHRGNGKGWLPAMTLLERRRPRDFGRFNRVEVEHRSLSISVVIEGPAAEAIARLAAQELAPLAPPPDVPGGILSLPPPQGGTELDPTPAPSP